MKIYISTDTKTPTQNRNEKNKNKLLVQDIEWVKGIVII